MRNNKRLSIKSFKTVQNDVAGVENVVQSEKIHNQYQLRKICMNLLNKKILWYTWLVQRCIISWFFPFSHDVIEIKVKKIQIHVSKVI